MQIREYGEPDRAVLIEQFRALNRHEDLISGDRRTDQQGAIESLDAALGRVRDSRGTAFVAEHDGQLLGFLFVVVEQSAVFVREELREHAKIAEFFVRETARGSGVGKALLGAAERFTTARALSRLSVGVLSGNTGALAAYARLGFTPYAAELTKTVRGS
jgi:GNAT superfamily N-acetyltransferase